MLEQRHLLTIVDDRITAIDEAGAFLKTFAKEPPIKPGTPDPYTPPGPTELRMEEHLQIGAITR
jgi:hypothetical protein